jgi:autonomous glycyl radical cofactor GrcA
LNSPPSAHPYEKTRFSGFAVRRCPLLTAQSRDIC